MTPATIIAEARADGITVALAPDGGLRFKGPRAATDKWLPVLRQTKPAIVALLTSPGRPKWDATDWLAFFDERAGILEYDGGLPRHEAEARAWEACIAEWLTQNPVCSVPGRCRTCGDSSAQEPLLPYGTTETGHTWLHRGCWSAWYDARKLEAVAALKALGVNAKTETKL